MSIPINGGMSSASGVTPKTAVSPLASLPAEGPAAPAGPKMGGDQFTRSGTNSSNLGLAPFDVADRRGGGR